MAVRKKKVTSKKKATASKAVATRSSQSNLPVSWEDRLSKYAQQEAQKIPVGLGQSISIRGGVFKFAGADLGEAMDVIVTHHAFTNAYYDQPYDSDNPVPPTCFANGMDSKTLVPVENSPEKQAEACAGCWANAFGSDQRGKGKACKNMATLLLLPADIEVDGFEDPQVATINVPPTSVANWNKFAEKMTKGLKRPTWSVVATIAFDPKSDYEKLIFGLKEVIEDDALLDKLEAFFNNDAYQARVLAVPDFTPRDEEEEGSSKGGRRKKAPAKKKPAAKKKRASRFS